MGGVGAGPTGTGVQPANGGNSSCGGIESVGGGAGQWDNFKSGRNGGSGGGAASGSAGLGTAGQGNNGGGSMASSPYNWGGGGGAGTVGETGTTARVGNGGDGVYYGDLFGGIGVEGWVGGGGGGGSHNPVPTSGNRGMGGLGGGGNGGIPGVANNGDDGAPNSGGGGGGASTPYGGSNRGGNGGSGIVVIRFPVSAATVQVNPTDISGLVLALDASNPASYPGSGYTWFDTSGNGYNGTLINGATYDPQGGGNMLFDGVNDYMALPNNIGYGQTVSVFTWVKVNGNPPGNYHIILGGQELEMSIPTSGEIRTGVFTGSRFVSNHGTGLTNGGWHHVGFTFDGTTKTSFINGVNVGTQTASGTLVNTFNNRTSGRFGGSTVYFLNGNIAAMHIYDRSLTALEVSATHATQQPRFQ